MEDRAPDGMAEEEEVVAEEEMKNVEEGEALS